MSEEKDTAKQTKKRRFFRNKWETMDDPTPRDSMYSSALGWFHERNTVTQRLVMIAGIIVIIAAFGGTIAFGLASANNATDPSQTAAQMLGADQNTEQDATDEEDTADVLDRFINVEAYAHLSDDTLQDFAQQFCDYLAKQGVSDSEYIMCYSRIDVNDDIYTFWASCPNNQNFYCITFDLSNKSFTFEPCDMPEGLPEINYEILEAQKNSEPVYSNPESTEPSAETQTQEQTTEPATTEPASTAAMYAAVTDSATLAGVLPQESVSLLPDAVVGWCGSKGIATSAANCLVNLSSINGNEFSMQVTADNGTVYSVSAEWNSGMKQFGMELI